MKRALRRDPAIRRIIRAWRELTGGKDVRDAKRRTLIACSGGADSRALALALAAASNNLIVGHVVHDVRPESESLTDRDAARDVAHFTGLDFRDRSIQVRSLAGNTEANARRLRYAALLDLAREHACIAVATAH